MKVPGDMTNPDMKSRLWCSPITLMQVISVVDCDRNMRHPFTCWIDCVCEMTFLVACETRVRLWRHCISLVFRNITATPLKEHLWLNMSQHDSLWHTKIILIDIYMFNIIWYTVTHLGINGPLYWRFATGVHQEQNGPAKSQLFIRQDVFTCGSWSHVKVIISQRWVLGVNVGYS